MDLRHPLAKLRWDYSSPRVYLDVFDLLGFIVPSGEVSERFKEHAWKACVGEIQPWVRIPPSPPFFQQLAGSNDPELAICFEMDELCGEILDTPTIP
jgi:hypothetical protein